MAPLHPAPWVWGFPPHTGAAVPPQPPCYPRPHQGSRKPGQPALGRAVLRVRPEGLAGTGSGRWRWRVSAEPPLARLRALSCLPFAAGWCWTAPGSRCPPRAAARAAPAGLEHTFSRVPSTSLGSCFPCRFFSQSDWVWDLSGEEASSPWAPVASAAAALALQWSASRGQGGPVSSSVPSTLPACGDTEETDARSPEEAGAALGPAAPRRDVRSRAGSWRRCFGPLASPALV